jgi:hypothetical protein
MKSRLILIPMILATTAATADHLPALSKSTSADGQTQAAALLGGQKDVISSTRAPLSSSSSVAPASKALDAQAQAASLLSRGR